MAMVIPTKTEYAKDTVEVLKSINTLMGENARVNRDQASISKDTAEDLKKGYIDRQKEIKSLLKQEVINETIAKELRESNKANFATDFKQAHQESINNFQQAIIDRKLALGLFSEREEEKLKIDKERLELQRQASQKDMEILKLAQGGFISPTQERYLKLKNKATLYIHKQLVKKKWLQKVGKNLLTLVKSAGSTIFSLLKGLFMLAIFDPKGKFLSSIIGFITNMVIMFVNILAKHIPRIVRSMIFIITKVLPPALQKAIVAIFEAIGGMLQAWAIELKKNSPFFGWVIEQFAKLFGPDGILTTFFKGLAGLLPIFIAIGLAVKAIIFLMPVFAVIKSAVLGFVAVMGTAAAPFIALGVAVVGAIALIYIFRKEIMSFFVDVGTWIGEAFSSVKNWVSKAFNWINDIFSTVWAWAKGINLGAVFKIVWKEFKKFGKYIWKQIKKAGNYLLSKIKNVINSITSLFSSVFGPVFDVFKEMGMFFSELLAPVFERLSPVLEKIGSVLKNIWDNVIFFIIKAMKSVKKTISELSSWFTGSSQFGAIDWARKSESEKRRFSKLSSAAEGKVDMDIMEAWVEANDKQRRALEREGKGDVLTMESIEAAKQLQKLTGNMDRNFEKLLDVTIANGQTARKAETVFKTIKTFKKLRTRKKR
jgi:hypothetical protein